MTDFSSPHFALTCPDEWGSQSIPDGVVIGAPPADGFQPTIVVRESYAGDTSVRDLAYATATRLHHDLVGAFVLRVQADDGPLGERRRLHTVTPLDNPNAGCVTSVIDHLIVDGIAVELTATVPTDWGWRWVIALEDVLDTIARRSDPSSEPLTTTASAPRAPLDPLGSETAGRPMESLDALHTGQGFWLAKGQAALAQADLDELGPLLAGGRLFRPKVAPDSPSLAPLQHARLVRADGALSDAGSQAATLQRRGHSWTIERTRGDDQRFLRAWTHQGKSFVVADRPFFADDGEGLLVGFVENVDLFRVVWSWSGLTPSWPGKATLQTHSMQELLTQVLRGTIDDPSPVAHAIREYVALTASAHPDDTLAWFWADGHGPLGIVPGQSSYVATQDRAADELWFVVAEFLSTYAF